MTSRVGLHLRGDILFNELIVLSEELGEHQLGHCPRLCGVVRGSPPASPPCVKATVKHRSGTLPDHAPPF